MKKAGIITKWLKINGKKFSEAAEILDFKSENGFRDAINNGTLTPIRTVLLAELVGKPHAVLVDFLTDGALETGLLIEEPGVDYRKSISNAKDPHDLGIRLFEWKDEIDGLVRGFSDFQEYMKQRGNQNQDKT